MRCTGCGMKIAFAGEVCPYCLLQKKGDQTGTVVTGAGLLLGGFIGNVIGGFGGILIGGFVLGLLAAIVSMSGRKHTAKKRPRVRVDGPVTTRPHARSKKDTAAVDEAPEPRLRRLNHLRAQGLLSEQEYRNQRKAIISQL